ncbi:unnamed protein product [Arabidopsis halleri]
MAVPVCMALHRALPKPWIPLTLFACSAGSPVVLTFIECVFKNTNLKYTFLESLLALGYFLLGGVILMLCGMLVQPRVLRIGRLKTRKGAIRIMGNVGRLW